MEIDKMAQAILRRQGIGIRERVVRYRGAILIFRYSRDGYEVLDNGVKVQFMQTKNINEAVRLYKASHGGPNA